MDLRCIEPSWHGKSPEYYEDDDDESYDEYEEMKRDYQADMEEYNENS